MSTAPGVSPYLPPREAQPISIVHASGICTTFERPDPLEGLPYRAGDLGTGTIVSCPLCYLAGVLPEPGHLGAFLPPGAVWDPGAGTVTWVYQV
jgi:hypothetical protein